MDFRYVPSYGECVDIVVNNPCFIKKDEIVDGIPITTFAYRLATAEDFCCKGARNLRGITFREDTKEILALPLHKFWNLGENQCTEINTVRNKNILRVTEKYDGSLVYFFMINGELCCKTKLNSFSEQAIIAMDIVEENDVLKKSIIELIQNGYTPMFEYISPQNQIVIKYDDEDLKYIGARNMTDGTYDFDPIEGSDPVETFNLDNIDEVINIAKDYSGHEGFVVVFDDHDMVKIKTSEYFKLHKIRENILNESVLAELILNENLDDIKYTLFSSESDLLNYIECFEKKVVDRYNQLINAAQRYYETYRHLDRKTYAITAQQELDRTSFGLAMELYAKGSIDEKNFKQFFLAKKLWENN